MLTIDNREEVQQLILNETGAPYTAEEIITHLENQESLSQIYDVVINESEKYVIFDDSFSHSIEEVESIATLIHEDHVNQDDNVNNLNIPELHDCFLNSSLPELVEQIAAIITVGDFSYKLYQESQGTINSFIKTNASKEEIKTRIKDLLTEVIKKLKIRDTREEDEKTTDG